VRVRHSDGDEHVMNWDGCRLGADWIIPAAVFVPHLDPDQSLSRAAKHSVGARRAAETFVLERWV
jgi:hypothetical protein